MNALSNFCFISRADNTALSGDPPSMYRSKMPAGSKLDEILEQAICPRSLFDDDFEKFLKDRAELLAQEGTRLIAP